MPVTQTHFTDSSWIIQHHLSICCLCKCLFKLTSQEISKLYITYSPYSKLPRRWFGDTGCEWHWKPRIIMMPTLSSLVALEVVIMTTSSSTSDDKFGIMKSLNFLCKVVRFLMGLPPHEAAAASAGVQQNVGRCHLLIKLSSIRVNLMN